MTDESPRQKPPESTGTGRPFSLMKWILLGGAVVLLIPSGAIFVWAWMMSDTFVHYARWPGGNPPAPMSLAAAREAWYYPYLFALFLGLPLFTLWSIVCVIVTLVKRVRSER